LFSNN